MSIAKTRNAIAEALLFSGSYEDDRAWLTHKDGVYTIRNGFYYQHGKTSQDHANEVTAQLTAAGIAHEVVEQGTEHKGFSGGASVKASSHWWVAVRIN
jgi:hypothetical protein